MGEVLPESLCSEFLLIYSLKKLPPSSKSLIPSRFFSLYTCDVGSMLRRPHLPRPLFLVYSGSRLIHIRGQKVGRAREGGANRGKGATCASLHPLTLSLSHFQTHTHTQLFKSGGELITRNTYFYKRPQASDCNTTCF